MIFDKGDKAVISGERFICLVADEEYAVLAKKKDRKVSFEDVRVYSNFDDWEEHIIGLEKIVKEH